MARQLHEIIDKMRKLERELLELSNDHLLLDYNLVNKVTDPGTMDLIASLMPKGVQRSYMICWAKRIRRDSK